MQILYIQLVWLSFSSSPHLGSFFLSHKSSNNIYMYTMVIGGCGRSAFSVIRWSRSSKLWSSVYIEYIYIYAYYSHARLLITNCIVYNMFLTPIYRVLFQSWMKKSCASVERWYTDVPSLASESYSNHIGVPRVYHTLNHMTNLDLMDFESRRGVDTCYGPWGCDA